MPKTDTDNRRYALLCSLAFMPAATATVRELHQEMGRVHSLAVSRDLVRGDLTWLAEQGLVRQQGDQVQATERGQDVARRDAAWPGQ